MNAIILAAAFAVLVNGVVVDKWDGDSKKTPNLSGNKELVPAPSYVEKGWKWKEETKEWVQPNGIPANPASQSAATDSEKIQKIAMRLLQISAEPVTRETKREIFTLSRELGLLGRQNRTEQ